MKPAPLGVADLAVARIQSAMDEAEAMIDGFLAKRYPLPLASVPIIITGWARAIVRYKLHANRISGRKIRPDPARLPRCRQLLQWTADGAFSLGGMDPIQSATALATDVLISAPPAVFGRNELGASGEQRAV